MPRHRSRQNATHELTATHEGEIPCSDDTACPPGTSCGEDGVCVGGYGNPVSGETVVIEDEPVEYDSGGTSYVRGDTGDRVRRAPTVEGRGALAKLIEEGDDVTLEPLDASATAIENVEVVGIDTEYGRRSRVGTVTIELGGV